MTIIVRNEADIIGENIDYHLRAGVDHVLALDNGSTDGTTEILEEYHRMGVLDLLRDDGEDFPKQRWGEELVHRANARLAPDWLISNDADEFYVAAQGNDLKASLAGQADAQVLTCIRRNMVGDRHALARAGWKATLRYRSTLNVPPPVGLNDPSVALTYPYFCYSLPDKVIFRPQTMRRLWKGAHAVELAKPHVATLGKIGIFHFPVRSMAEFRASVFRFGVFAERSWQATGESGKYVRWKRMLDAGQDIEVVFAEALPDAAGVRSLLAKGQLVQEPLSFLAAAKDAASPPLV